MHLITRPLPDAERMAQRLRAMGQVVLVDPLLQEVAGASPHPWETLQFYRGVITTSQRAIHILAAQTLERSMPLWVVGDASERCARMHGFMAVQHGGGDVRCLVEGLLEWAKKTDPIDSLCAHSFLYLSGADVTVDLPSVLAKHGLVCTRWVIYTMLQQTTFFPETIAALQAGAVTTVSLYSKRTAEAFVRAVQSAGVSLRTVNIHCPSQAILNHAQTLFHLNFREEEQPCCILIPMAADPI